MKTIEIMGLGDTQPKRSAWGWVLGGAGLLAAAVSAFFLNRTTR